MPELRASVQVCPFNIGTCVCSRDCCGKDSVKFFALACPRFGWAACPGGSSHSMQTCLVPSADVPR